MTFEEWVDENIKYIRTPDIFQWLFEAWEAGAKAEREACAKLVEITHAEGLQSIREACAAAIRARTNND